jgi:glycosyltransferase involved in cell wall biosynthesis
VRVAQYYPSALQGEFGTSIAVRGWCSALADQGIDIRLIATTAGAWIQPPEGTDLVDVHDRRSGLQPPGYLRGHFSGQDLVVFHGGWDPGNLMAAREARAVGVPYVVMPHGVYYPEVFLRRKVLLKRLWWSILERRYLRRALAIHLFFPQEVAGLEDRGVRRPIVVAPNGFSAPAGIAWQPEPEPYIAWLGRYDPEHKGLDLLLRAMHSIEPQARPRVELHGVDWNGKRADVTRLVVELGLSDDVAVLDPIYGDDKWAFLARAQAFVYPSRWDASPISVVEALSIGLPSLLTSFPLGSFAGSRNAAIVVEPTVGALAEGLRQVVAPGASALGQRAMALIRGELSWSAVATSWIEQISPLLETRGRGDRIEPTGS